MNSYSETLVRLINDIYDKFLDTDFKNKTFVAAEKYEVLLETIKKEIPNFQKNADALWNDIRQSDDQRIAEFTQDSVVEWLNTMLKDVYSKLIKVIPASSFSANTNLDFDFDLDLIVIVRDLNSKILKNIIKVFEDNDIYYVEERGIDLSQRWMFNFQYQGFLIDISVRDEQNAKPTISTHHAIEQDTNEMKAIITYCKSLLHEEFPVEYKKFKALMYTAYAVRTGYDHFFQI